MLFVRESYNVKGVGSIQKSKKARNFQIKNDGRKKHVLGDRNIDRLPGEVGLGQVSPQINNLTS